MNSASFTAATSRACNCIGPQNGQPLCPCQMGGVVERDGRWVETERDLGPVRFQPLQLASVATAMIELPFPPSSLSGHNKGHWHAKSGTVAKHREWAKNATLAAKIGVPATGDIKVIVAFYPPNRRGDRVNFPNRCKPYFDGIADALKVNDSRFVPSYQFGEPVKGGRVVVTLA